MTDDLERRLRERPCGVFRESLLHNEAADELARLRGALAFIADTPDPGEEKERSATFYRIHAGMLKQVAAKGLGRETVSQEAMDWAERWTNSPEGQAALKGSRHE